MKNKEEILNKINELKEEREQLELQYQNISDGNDQDTYEQLSYIDIDIDVLDQKIRLLEWVLSE